MIEKPDMALPTARATAAEPEVSSLRGGIANAGPEVSELLNVHLKDATDFHADWTAEGLALSPEEKAAELNRVFRHLAIPENDIAARLRGEAMMLDDTAHCRLNTFDCKTMTKIVPTRREEVLAKSEQNLAALLKRAADLLESHANAKAMEARQGQDPQGLDGDSHDSAVGNADLPNTPNAPEKE